MALPVETQVKYWSIATVAFLGLLWLLGDILLPFLIGGAIAYLLDPVADWFEERGCSRIIATSLTTLAAVLIFILAISAFIPTLIVQTSALIDALPDIVANVTARLETSFPGLFGESMMQQSFERFGTFLQERGGQIATALFSSVNSVISVLVLLVIVPVVAFYLLMDWDNMIARIDDLLPRDHAPTVRKLAREMDQTMAGFLRGQGTVCLILGTFYAVSLMAVGLQFGLVVGFVAGLISFIPYVGALVGGALAIGLALFQWWGSVEVADGDTIAYATNWTRIAIVGAIFAAGQMLEGNILTPKLVGGSVGLHPVWLIFALSVFGTLFGFAGMLIAVPVAAMIGVLARFAIREYKGGRLYRGLDHDT